MLPDAIERQRAQTTKLKKKIQLVASINLYFYKEVLSRIVAYLSRYLSKAVL